MRLLVVYCEVPLGLGRCAAQTTRGCTRTTSEGLEAGGCALVIVVVWWRAQESVSCRCRAASLPPRPRHDRKIEMGEKEEIAPSDNGAYGTR